MAYSNSVQKRENMVRPLIYGHRGMGCSLPGALSFFPENSMTSFREAQRIGADGIELDVFLSKNNELLVMHGYLQKHSLCLTTMKRKADSGIQRFNTDNYVESEDVHATDLVLKKPRRLTQKSIELQEIPQHNGSNTDIFEEYISNMEQWDSGECVPTLDQVLVEFGDSLKYDIELKGSNVDLGLRVLDVLSKHPGLDVVISSFQWVAPNLNLSSSHANNPLEQYPNGTDVVDLLGPLINNKLNIPIALLFNNETSELPSLERIVECCRHYNATWAVVSHEFWKMGTPILGSDVKGKEAVPYLVNYMHDHGLKVMSYFLESRPDSDEELQVQIESGMDAVCPNDVVKCLGFVNK
uniref:Glycerophosphoryl diester phosphodiesterase, putative n=1 Tax=Babesia bovis TaxID=5865 RepID=S6B8G3_BABBO|nr:glycerophosphoryl diester phosphodiesterase, putative [Babesia bovis]